MDAYIIQTAKNITVFIVIIVERFARDFVIYARNDVIIQSKTRGPHLASFGNKTTILSKTRDSIHQRRVPRPKRSNISRTETKDRLSIPQRETARFNSSPALGLGRSSDHHS